MSINIDKNVRNFYYSFLGEIVFFKRSKSIKDFKEIEDIKAFHNTESKFSSSDDKRSKVNICVIDDEHFAPQNNLSSYGYVIEPLSDIKRTNEVAAYQIVLCDLMGVGQFFDPQLQGASIIREIKYTYPEKIVIAYTGAAMNAIAAKEATKYADALIKKDTNMSDWIKLLDAHSEKAMDPYQIWLRIRLRLIEMNISTKEILVAEDAFVQSIMEKDANLKTLTSAISESGIVGDGRAMLQSLGGSMLFRAIFGV